jgi:hypothetical protein
MSDTPTGCAIVDAVRASLRLVSCLSELLTASQLRVVKQNLCEVVAIVEGQIHAAESGMFAGNIFKCLVTHPNFSGNNRVVIELMDTDDEEEGLPTPGKKDDGNAVGGMCPVPFASVAALSRQSQEARVEMRLVRWECRSHRLVQILTSPPISSNPRSRPDEPTGSGRTTRDGRSTQVLVCR